MLGLAGVATAAGAYDTDEEGRYALTGLAAGAYRLACAGADRYLVTTPSTVDVTLAAGEQVGADFGMKQDERGRFRVEDLPAGDGYVVRVIGPRGLALTKEGRDSAVDWHTGESAPLALAPGEAVSGVDAGYAEVTGDTAITAASIDPNRTRFHVGDEFTIRLRLTNKGPVPDGVNIKIVRPLGLEVVDATGLTTLWTDTDLVGNLTSGYLDPGRSLVFTVTLRATAPIADGTIDVTTAPGEYGDSNPRDDARTFAIRVR